MNVVPLLNTAFEVNDLKQVALFIFLALFLLVILRILLVRASESERAARLPLEDDDDLLPSRIQENQENTGTTKNCDDPAIGEGSPT